MHKSEPVLENEMHKSLCDFEIRTDHLTPVRRPDLMIIYKKHPHKKKKKKKLTKKKKKKRKKRTCSLVDLAVPADHRGKIKES